MNDPHTDAEVVATAQRDQVLALLRDYASSCADVHDSFIIAGFTRDEAMQMTHRYLDKVEGFYEVD